MNDNAASASHFDLIVVGSGPAGQRAAIQAAKLRKSVAIIEKDSWGGNCVHKGTLPSKTLREAALAETKHDTGVLARVLARVKEVAEQESKVIEEAFQRNQVQQFRGTAQLTSDRSVEIKSPEKVLQLTASKIILATGSSPNRISGVDYDGRTVFDSDTILELTELPQTLVVMGAGVIGCEYASIFARLGCQVTLIDRRKDMLRSVDQEIVGNLITHLKQFSVNLKVGADIGPIKKVPAGGSFQIEIQSGNGAIRADAALICWGRSGNISHLNLQSAGIKADERGLLSVNDHYQTSAHNIYAVGDLIGNPALASSSSEQGRLAAAHAFDLKGYVFPKSFPYGIYTIPEISSIGAHEEELAQKKIPYIVAKAKFNETVRGLILRDYTGLLKMLVHKETHELLGVHIIGTNATELIHIGQAAFATGQKIEYLVDNVFNYPTLAEVYKVAAYRAMNQLA